MGEEDTLALQIRRKIFNYIAKSPGLHERELSRELNIPMSTLDYHLTYLKKRELITAESEAQYTRYYIVGEFGIKDKKILSILRQQLPRRILIYLLLHPNASHRKICNHLGVAPSTASFHLNKLVTYGIIKRIHMGKESTFWIPEPDNISDKLITYQKSFLDKAVDKFVEVWFEVNPEYIRKPRKRRKKR